MSKRAEQRALEAYPVPQLEGCSNILYDLECNHREGFVNGYEQAEKDILSIIQSRLEEIPGDAQPRPILRTELQELMNKIMEEER